LDLNALIFVAVTVAIAFVVIWHVAKWAQRRLVRRLVADVLGNTSTPDGHPKLKPESDYVVTVSDTLATCTRPDGTTEAVPWDDLQKVEIVTTDQGPFVPDIFWVLYGTKGGCIIPWGATGEKQLMDRFQALPGFRNDAIIGAATLTTNNRLTCWERLGHKKLR
jgi:hypothetical protein